MNNKNKKNVTEIYDQMIIDAKQKPDFLNMRNQLHKDMRGGITSLIIEMTALIKPYVLKTNCLNDIWLNYEFEWDTIEVVCRDIIIYFKIEDYLVNLLDKWLELTIDLEEYEVAENLNNFKRILETKRKVKNV
jgi:hypothetical protein